jgi:DNA-binding beta-propeller fold protein YncE
VQKTFQIGGAGRWDYATFDPDSHLLYVTRSTHTQGIDVNTGKVVADIDGQKRAHGTAIATSAGRGFISDGEDGSVVVFDLKTDKILGKITAADDADGIIYDPGSNRVLVACGDSQKLIVIDPTIDLKTGKADSVDLGGKPEFLAADGAGKAYVNINSKNEIAVVDIKTLAVTARWPTGSGTRPAGLAIDPKNHLLFVGCRNQKLIIMSADNGHVLAEPAIGSGNDACKFDPTTGEAFASCGDGTLTIVKQTSPDKFDVSAIPTKPGARTMAVDPDTNTLYLPTAEFASARAEGRRPAMKPNTFMIVVVAPIKQ